MSISILVLYIVFCFILQKKTTSSTFIIQSKQKLREFLCIFIIHWVAGPLLPPSLVLNFLLLARCIPNIAKRSVWEQCIYWRPTTDRPHILENFERPYLGNGSSDPLHVWFYIGFSGMADRMALFPVSPNPRWRSVAILENFKWPYLWNGSSDRLRVLY